MSKEVTQNASDVDAMAKSLLGQGVMLSSTVRYWRAAKMLKPADLGLPENGVNSDLVSLGHKKLVLKERLKELGRVESRVNAIMNSAGFSFMNIARFIPNEIIGELQVELNGLRSEFAAAKKEFIDNYDAIQAEARVEWEAEADKFREKGQPDVADRLLASIASAYPKKSELDRFFEFSVHCVSITAPNFVETDLEGMANKAKDVQAVLLARNALVSEARQDVARQMAGFGAECAQQLRQRFADLLDEVHSTLGTAKTRGGISQKTLNRLHDFYDSFKKLNFSNDTAFEGVLEGFRKAWLTHDAEHYRDAGTVGLRDAITSLGNGIRAMIEETMESSFAGSGGRAVLI